jgi:integrase
MDSNGVYRRYLGWKLSNGKLIQHLFRLGRDPEKARLANLRLEALWDAVVNRSKRLEPNGQGMEPRPLWDDATLAIGQAVARGEQMCSVTPPAELASLPAELQVAWLGRLQADFPIIPLRLEGPDIYIRGVDGIRQVIEVKSSFLAALKEPVSTKTLHQALDGYAAYIREKYKDKPSERPQQLSISLLRRHSENHSLDQLDADKIETWLAYWCRRPVSDSTKKPLAFTTCRNVLIVLRQFLRWLNRSRQQFGWQLPAAFTFPRCKIAKTAEDRVKKRQHFKIAELTVIWKYAKPWDRALILLALNCGFSKREIATLQLGEIVTRKGRTYIKRHRTKTDVYGEWLLWPETVEALDYLKGLHREDSVYVVNNQAGRHLAKGTPKGNENQTIKNHWDKIFKRMAEDRQSCRKLPFKHLRKTGATLMRHLKIENAAELASMYLAHGEKADSGDRLLPVYTERPWKKLHRALLRLRKKLLPILTSVAKPWEPTVMRIPLQKVAKVVELRKGGKTLTEIAGEVGLHWSTVRRICNRQCSPDRAEGSPGE